MKDRSITGYEALLRWQHPQLGDDPRRTCLFPSPKRAAPSCP
ncbi:hypothetical protein LN650_16390 [Klebsiella pneumoniae subsp. pneumoniae]|nr:hypothetical protein [Klebsiella pneumoniae subsp. pneumoniae]